MPSERSFGLSVGCASVAVAALLRWRGHVTSGTTLGTVGVLLICAGLLGIAWLAHCLAQWLRIRYDHGMIVVRKQ